MSWFVLIILSTIIVSFANILQKVLMRDDKSDPVSYSIIFAFLLGVISLVAALIFGFELPTVGPHLLFYLGAAILWGTGTIFFFKSLKLLESSEVIILGSLRSVVTISASLLFLNETFNIQKIAGTLLILFSIVIVANLKHGIKFNKGVHYAFGMVVCYGLAVVFDAFNLRTIEPLSYLTIINILIGTLLLAAFPRKFSKLKVITDTDFLKKMLPLSFFTAFQAIAYYFALAAGPASQIAPIGQSQVILTIILAALILNERDNLLRKFLAAILVSGGVLLLR